MLGFVMVPSSLNFDPWTSPICILLCYLVFSFIIKLSSVLPSSQLLWNGKDSFLHWETINKFCRKEPGKRLRNTKCMMFCSIPMFILRRFNRGRNMTRQQVFLLMETQKLQIIRFLSFIELLHFQNNYGCKILSKLFKQLDTKQYETLIFVDFICCL